MFCGFADRLYCVERSTAKTLLSLGSEWRRSECSYLSYCWARKPELLLKCVVCKVKERVINDLWNMLSVSVGLT